MDDDGVTVAYELEQGVELRAVDVASGGLVAEDPIRVDAFELAVGVLIEAAHSDVADVLSAHVAPVVEVSG